MRRSMPFENAISAQQNRWWEPMKAALGKHKISFGRRAGFDCRSRSLGVYHRLGYDAAKLRQSRGGGAA
jgi:hypothetical protein